MHSARNPHPSVDELTAFDRGQLPAARRAAVEQHVAGCADCCQRLESLDEDGLIALLRTSVGLSSVSLSDTSDPLPASSDTPRQAEARIPPELVDHPRYRVLGPIGAGGMGVVFKAEHRLMERTVALKIIHKEFTARCEVVERFRQEVKAAARLSHPNIVTAYDAEQAGDLHFLVMEFIEGISLDRLVQMCGPLQVGLACDIIYQAALGLQHAHERGMVHRDIKPHNLLRTSEGQVKILDFGLARWIGETQPGGSLTVPGMVIGTPDYVAPEQALDSRQTDIRTDLYSLGCTLYFLLAGRPPFPEGSALQKLMAHRERTPRSLRELRPDVPAEVLRILDRLMAKAPARRYQTPAEAAEQLRPFADAGSAPVIRTARTDATMLEVASLPEVQAAAPQRSLRLFWLACSLLVGMVLLGLGLGGVLLALWYFHPKDAGSPPPASQDTVVSFGSSKPFTRAVIRADCRQALVVYTGNVVGLWDLEKQQEIDRLEGHSARPMALAFSADGQQAATSGIDGTIRLWDLRTRRVSQTFDNQQIWIRGVDFWNGQSTLLSGDNQARLILWDCATGKMRDALAGHEALIYDVKVSGDWAITASDDHTARVWDLRQRQQAHCLRGHENAVTCAVLSSDGQYALTGSGDNTVRFWDVAREKPLQILFGHAARLNALALSSDHRRALSGDQKGFIRLWDVQKGEELQSYQEPHGGIIRALAFCPDGRRFLSADDSGTFRFWKLPQ